MRFVSLLLLLIVLPACVGGASRNYQFSPTENEALLLLDIPTMLPLPATFASEHHLKESNWAAHTMWIVPVSDGGVAGPETSILLTQDNRLLTRNRALMSFQGAVPMVGSVFAPAQLRAGKYAVTRVEGQMPNYGGATVEMITYCPLSNAPVFEVRAGEVDVLDLAEIFGISDTQNLWGRNGHWSSDDRAHELLTEYRGINAPLATTHVSEHLILQRGHDNSWGGDCVLAMH